MKPTIIILTTLILMLPAVAAEDATTDLAGSSPGGALDENGCNNYGNTVTAGTDYNCSSGSDCNNYGFIVLVAADYDCKGGDCQNHGVVVNVAGGYCDEAGLVCLGGECVQNRGARAQASAGPTDCMPEVTVEHLAIHVTCKSTDEPCGISQEPLCWTVRFACGSDEGQVTFRLYEEVVSRVRPDWPSSPSECETQPGCCGDHTEGGSIAGEADG